MLWKPPGGTSRLGKVLMYFMLKGYLVPSNIFRESLHWDWNCCFHPWGQWFGVLLVFMYPVLEFPRRSGMRMCKWFMKGVLPGPGKKLRKSWRKQNRGGERQTTVWLRQNLPKGDVNLVLGGILKFSLWARLSSLLPLSSWLRANPRGRTHPDTFSKGSSGPESSPPESSRRLEAKARWRQGGTRCKGVASIWRSTSRVPSALDVQCQGHHSL